MLSVIDKRKWGECHLFICFLANSQIVCLIQRIGVVYITEYQYTYIDYKHGGYIFAIIDSL